MPLRVHEPDQATDKQIRTVADLRRLIADLPDDLPVSHYLALRPDSADIDGVALAENLAVLPKSLSLESTPQRLTLVLLAGIHLSADLASYLFDLVGESDDLEDGPNNGPDLGIFPG